MSQALAAVTALRRGDISMIDHVPPDQVASLSETPEIQVGQYSQPVIHVIAIDGRNPFLRSRALRRGLSNAVDRQGLLEETVLKHPLNDVDCPADGPFPKGIYADATAVKPLGFDILLAKMLVAAARKRPVSGGPPIRLRFEYPAIPECRTVVVKLAEAFRIAGVEIEPIEVPESRLESELRAGRRFDLAYRVLRCDDPIQDAGTLLCPAYDAPPESDPLASAASPRILQLLLQLEPEPAEWPTQRGASRSRSTASRATSWPSSRCGSSPTTTPGGRGSEVVRRDRPPTGSIEHLEEWEISPWIAQGPVGYKPRSPGRRR